MTSAIKPEDEKLIANAERELVVALSNNQFKHSDTAEVAKKIKALIFVIVTLMTEGRP